MPETTTTEAVLALRRTDGDTIGDEFTFLITSRESPWDAVDGYFDEEDDPVEIELIRMDITSIEKRAIGGPRPVCDEWSGYEQEAGTRWEVVIPKGKDDSTWPGRPVSLATFDDPNDADAAIAAMPEVFHHHTYGMRTQEIERASLVIVPRDQFGYVSNCARCGHPRSEHG
jgi:hypothetical protein